MCPIFSKNESFLQLVLMFDTETRLLTDVHVSCNFILY